MRLVLVLFPLLLAGGGASAQSSLFGRADRVPANPFASNYASPPVVTGPSVGSGRVRRARHAPGRAPAPLRPPRDIPR